MDKGNTPIDRAKALLARLEGGTEGVYLVPVKDILAGYIGAVQAHLERPESEHDGGCCAGFSGSRRPCECSQRHRTQALAEFKRLFP